MGARVDVGPLASLAALARPAPVSPVSPPTRPCRDCGRPVWRRQGGALGPARCRACLRKRAGLRAGLRRARAILAGPPMVRDGGPAEHFGKGWPVKAAAIRARDGDRCQRCDRPWTLDDGARFPVDHIVPRRLFQRPDGTYDDAWANQHWNLATLCPACHGWKTARAERLALRGDRHDLMGYLRAIRLRSVTDALD